MPTAPHYFSRKPRKKDTMQEIAGYKRDDIEAARKTEIVTSEPLGTKCVYVFRVLLRIHS